MGFMRVFALAWTAPLLACPEAAQPVERRQENNIWQYVYDLNEASTWLSSETAPIPKQLLEYRDYANKNTDTDPFILLARQRAVFEEAYGPLDGSVKAFRLIENREVGRISNSTCVELMLMAEHLKFHHLNVPGSEFSAHIFRKGSRLKVFAAFIEHESMGAPAVNISPAKRQDMQHNAWNFVAFLHNHPFSFDNPYGDISGTVIPSEPDLMTFRAFFQTEALQVAWITNGIHSARYNSTDTERLIEAEGL
jgi:hypothetical protein